MLRAISPLSDCSAFGLEVRTSAETGQPPVFAAHSGVDMTCMAMWLGMIDFCRPQQAAKSQRLWS